jgi:hypothetical protein
MSSPASLLVEEALSLNLKTKDSFAGSDAAQAVVEAFRWLDLGKLDLDWFHAEAYQAYEVRRARVMLFRRVALKLSFVCGVCRQESSRSVSPVAQCVRLRGSAARPCLYEAHLIVHACGIADVSDLEKV